jgi:hypothetical protein
MSRPEPRTPEATPEATPEPRTLAGIAQERQAEASWAALRDRLPSAAGPPPGWRRIVAGADGAAYRLAAGGHLSVIESVCREADGRRWHHVSVARRDRDPTWAELLDVKRAFIGPDEEAYLVAPPEGRYVNLYRHCLHWWHCLDAPGGAVLPAFEGALAGGRTI